MLYRIKIIKFDLDNLHIFHETNHGGTEIICENRYTSFPLNSANYAANIGNKIVCK